MRQKCASSTSLVDTIRPCQVPEQHMSHQHGLRRGNEQHQPDPTLSSSRALPCTAARLSRSMSAAEKVNCRHAQGCIRSRPTTPLIAMPVSLPSAIGSG